MFTLFHTVHQIETDVSFGFIGKQRLYGTIWIKGVASNDTKYRKTVYRSWKQIMSLWIILSRSSVSSVFVLPTMLNRMKKICNTLSFSTSALTGGCWETFLEVFPQKCPGGHRLKILLFNLV